MPAEVGEQTRELLRSQHRSPTRGLRTPPRTMESGASTPRHSIHEAVIRRDARAIAHFLQKQPDCVLQQDSDGRTPLQFR